MPPRAAFWRARDKEPTQDALPESDVEQEKVWANLLVGMMTAREQEGERVSRVLHDEVGQVLSAIGLQLDLLRMDIAENPAASAARISEIQKVLEQAVGQVRDLSYELNPAIVERTGLQFALDRLVGRYRKSYPGKLRLLFDSSVRVPLEQATAMYKIAEQALENAMQLPGGSQVEILVRPAKRAVTLEIRDNGPATGPQKPQHGDATGLGFHIMKYHASRAGLDFSVAASGEKSTIVRAIYRTSKS